jgi:hypothetical protein
MYNKRIQELAEQAGYKHPDAVGKCEDYAYFDHEKFAELIVRECIDEVSDLMDYEGEGVDLATLRFVRRIIKEHFGVEE